MLKLAYQEWTTEEPTEEKKEAEAMKNNFYITNKETNKIELHFDKSVYMGLDDATKQEIKSACLWSRSGSCWVSRGHLGSWSAINVKRIAEKLGLENAGAEGERLSFAEQMERKAERAEARAEIYEARADRAAANGEALQAPIESMRGDTAFFTQPNINSSAGRAFTNRRKRMYAAFEKGFEEFKRSEYWNERAEAARATAKGCQVQSVGFCQRRIDECNAGIKKLFKNIEGYKKHLEKLEAGETIKLYGGELLTVDKVNEWLESTLDRIEAYTDKASYYQAMIEEQGGLKFSKENVNLGDIVTVERWGRVEVVRKGTKNFVGKLVDRSTGTLPTGTLQFAYTEIKELCEKAPEDRAEGRQLAHGFRAGDVYTLRKWDSESWAYIPCKVEIVKVTADKATVKVDGGRAKSLAIRDSYSGGYYIPVNTSEPGSIEHYEWIHPKTQNA